MQPTEHSPEFELFSTRHVAVVEQDRTAAEILHTFFRLMELECSLVSPDSGAVATVRRLEPDVLILDLDVPDLRALEIAHAVRLHRPLLPIVFLTDEDDPQPLPFDAPILAKPHERFEDLLALLEAVLVFDR